MNIKLNEPSNVIFFDFETTGLNIKTLKVIDVAFKTLFIDDIGYQDLIKIDTPLPSQIVKLTGITNSMLMKNGLDESLVIKKIMNYINRIDIISDHDYIYFVAHNGNSFDFVIFKNLLVKYDIPLDKKWKFIDTLQLSRKYNKGSGNSMGKLCEKFGVVNEAAHRAMGDVNALMNIYLCISNDIYNLTVHNKINSKLNNLIKTLEFPEQLIQFINH